MNPGPGDEPNDSSSETELENLEKLKKENMKFRIEIKELKKRLKEPI